MQPTLISTETIDNFATVKGRGTPGFIATVYCDGKKCGEALVGPDGTFTLTTTYRRSGTTVLTVSQMDSAGRESDVADANKAVILQPPKVTSISAKGRTATIIGTGAPGAGIKIYDKNNKVVAATTVKWDGTWEAKVHDLTLGTHPFTATQQDVAGVSDVMNCGSVTIAAPPPPTVTKTSLRGNVALVDGTGVPGARIDLYEGSTLLGSTTVKQDGTYQVESFGLSMGTHPLQVKQVTDVGESGFIDAKSVSITKPPPAAPVWVSTVLLPPANNTAQVNGTSCTPAATVNVLGNGTNSGSGTCTQDGTFSIITAPLDPGLHTFQIDQTVNDYTSLPVPAGSVTVVLAPPTVSETTLTPDRKGKVTGRGTPGLTIELLDENNKLIGEAVVAADGTFVVVSVDELPSGTNPLKIRQVDDSGHKSTFIPAGDLVVPPIVTSSTLESDKKGAIHGKGKPGATITLYEPNGTPIGTTVVDRYVDCSLRPIRATSGDLTGLAFLLCSMLSSFGNFTVLTPNPLPPGTYDFDITQTDKGVESLKVPAPPLVVSAAGGVSSPVVTASALVGGLGVVYGKGTPGATIKLYDGGVFVGTGTVDRLVRLRCLHLSRNFGPIAIAYKHCFL